MAILFTPLPTPTHSNNTPSPSTPKKQAAIKQKHLLDLLGLFLWGKDESLDRKLTEQVKVTSIHESSRKDVIPSDSAIRSLLVHKDSRHDADGGTDNHLTDLSEGDDNWFHPLWFGSDGHQEVVSVHDSVNGVVHSAEDKTG